MEIINIFVKVLKKKCYIVIDVDDIYSLQKIGLPEMQTIKNLTSKISVHHRSHLILGFFINISQRDRLHMSIARIIQNWEKKNQVNKRKNHDFSTNYVYYRWVPGSFFRSQTRNILCHQSPIPMPKVRSRTLLKTFENWYKIYFSDLKQNNCNIYKERDNTNKTILSLYIYVYTGYIRGTPELMGQSVRKAKIHI